MLCIREIVGSVNNVRGRLCYEVRFAITRKWAGKVNHYSVSDIGEASCKQTQEGMNHAT
jgi:hypothetical protein